VPGLEEVVDGVYRRVVAAAPPASAAAAAPTAPPVPAAPHVIALADPAARPILGADPAAAEAHLARDPVLAPLVAARPGLRVPGTVDGGELAIRAVLGQQVSLAAARTLAARLVAAVGEPLPHPDGTLTHAWPAPEAIVEYAPTMAMPRARQRAIAALAGALADGLRLEPGADVRAELLALPGIGPWTADYIALRVLRDPDAWLPTDLGVRHALARLGVGIDAADAWRPFRAHAVVHLWASL